MLLNEVERKHTIRCFESSVMLCIVVYITASRFHKLHKQSKVTIENKYGSVRIIISNNLVEAIYLLMKESKH